MYGLNYEPLRKILLTPVIVESFLCVHELGQESCPFFLRGLIFKTWHLLSLHQDPLKRKNVPEVWNQEPKAQYV